MSRMLWQKPQKSSGRALGFRPPRLVLDPDLEWVLKRAFGPPTWAPTRPVSGQNLVNVALRLDVASRIAAQHSRELIEREMGPVPGHRLREQYVGTVARGALLDHALNQLVDRARASEIPCILLKYAALSRMGVLRVGARVASDIDVLVPHARARELQRILQENGYRESSLPESNHQLPALLDPNGVLIELHLHVPLVTLPQTRAFARADDLLEAGLTTPSGNALLPDPAIVAAHAIAHGLMQHARAPHMYSPLKAFADLADLESKRPGLLEQTGAYLATTFTATDLSSVRTLARALARGDLDTAMKGEAGILLRHALASQLDRRYAIWLRLGSLARPRTRPARRGPTELIMALRAAWGWARSWSPTHRP